MMNKEQSHETLEGARWRSCMKENHMKDPKDTRNRSSIQGENDAGSYKVKLKKMFPKVGRHKPLQMKTRLRCLCSK